MRLDSRLFQQLSIIRHTESEISWWSGRDGLDPFSIEFFAANSIIPKNGGRPVSTCLE